MFKSQMKTSMHDLRLVFAASLAMGCLPLGCSDRTASVPPSTGENSADREGGELVILTWEEYFCPEAIERFEAETGIKVRFEYFDNLQEMKGLIVSEPDRFDLVVADGSTLADLIELQALKEIDRAKLGNFDNLDPRYLDLNFDPGNRFTIPYLWGTTVVAYRSDQIAEPARSWKALWDEKYAGKVFMLDDPFDSYAVSLMSLGYSANSEDPGQLKEASDLLLEQVNKVGAEYLDIIGIRERLLSGAGWIAMAYSSDAATLAEENEDISLFIPEEGATLWLDSFGIPREARNEANAVRFLDFMCRGEIAGMSSNFLWCATPNRAAGAHLSQELLAEETVYPPAEILSKCEFLLQPGPERNRWVNKGMKQVYDGLARAGQGPDAEAQASRDGEGEPRTPSSHEAPR